MEEVKAISLSASVSETTAAPAADIEAAKKRAETVRKVKKGIGLTVKILLFAFLILWSALSLFPFVWSFLSSFKNRSDVVLKPMTFTFKGLTTDNYVKIFQGSMNIGIAYLNSFFISGLVVIFTVFFSLLMAFVMARFHFKGKPIVNSLIVACMMFPAFSLLIPIVRILGTLNLFGERLGVVLPQVALNLGFTTILLTGFLKSLPLEIEEAAFIDGSGVCRTLFTICVPMARSALVTAVIFVFLWSYNDLFLQMIIISTEDKFPISLLLNKLATKESGFDYGKMAAAVTLVALPLIVVYLFLQKHIIKGLTAGAVKC